MVSYFLTDPLISSKIIAVSIYRLMSYCIVEQWDKSEDRIALIGLGFAGIVGVWAAINLVAVIVL